MRRPSRIGLSWMLVFAMSLPLTGQDIEAIGRGKPLSLSGGVSLNHVYYASRGLPVRRAPHNFFASANIALNLYGWTIPLSFSFSNQTSRFSQPFNQYALHPKWKWITAHIGYTSMSFSSYTVNGHVFKGLGADLEPGGHWKISLLYGRFLKGAERDAPASIPVFQRHGYAIRSRYTDGDNFIELILFQARDGINSIQMPPDSLHVTPQQNLVVSVRGTKTFYRNFRLSAEVATSALTRDARVAPTDHRHILANAGFLFKARTSTSYYEAWKSSFEYQRGGWTMGIGYERIDPGYRTFGAYYFNSDLENITLNGTARILHDKLMVNVSAGLQNDNLDNAKISTTHRTVTACNFNYTPSEKLNFSASWSTFQTFSNIRSRFRHMNELTTYDNLDTLNYTQVSRSASMSAMFVPRSKRGTIQSLTLNTAWQESMDLQGKMGDPLPASFYNLNAGYSISLVPKNLGASITLSASINQSALIQIRIIGPAASVTKTFFNRKLKTVLSVSCNKMKHNSIATGSLINGRLGGSLSLRKNHSFSVNVAVAKRTSAEKQTALELTATAGYQYSFSKTNRGHSPSH